jgi:hypothetical protein
VPELALSVRPSSGVPVTVGALVAEGGATVGDGAGAGATTPDADDTAEADPFLFDAVTRTRSVAETSPDPSAYVLDVAPCRSEHAFPDVSQRCHWNEYLTPAPDQLPGSAVSVEPTTAEPETDGDEVLTGGCFPGAGPGPAAAIPGTSGSAASAIAVANPEKFRGENLMPAQVGRLRVTRDPPIEGCRSAFRHCESVAAATLAGPVGDDSVTEDPAVRR